MNINIIIGLTKLKSAMADYLKGFAMAGDLGTLSDGHHVHAPCG
jgi:hypothetical protein